MKRRRLLIFARAPRPGEAKTRIGRRLGPGPAAALARALIEDTLDLAARAAATAGATVELAVTPDEPGPELLALLAELALPGLTLAPQGPGDLGGRLQRALARAPAAPRVVLGSDSPDLPPTRIVAAFALLERHPAVLGPAADGGYYLVGLAAGAPCPALEAGIRWSTAHALTDTAAALRRAGCPPALLEPWHDVDEVEDLLALRDRLSLAPAGVAPRTRGWLAGGHLDRGPDAGYSSRGQV